MSPPLVPRESISLLLKLDGKPELVTVVMLGADSPDDGDAMPACTLPAARSEGARGRLEGADDVAAEEGAAALSSASSAAPSDKAGAVDDGTLKSQGPWPSNDVPAAALCVEGDGL